ncbi:MAG: hypothetical protein AAF889_06565 [Cyanobacteria bacterium P01_D01_bin.73]
MTKSVTKKSLLAISALVSTIVTGTMLGAPLAGAMEQTLSVASDALPMAANGTAGGRAAIPGAIVPNGRGTPSDSCLGFASIQPNHQLELDTAPSALTITVNSYGANVDTTIAVKTPEGEWLCGDDISASNKDAAVTISDPTAGLYEVWVGTFDGNYADYELAID